MCVSLYHCVLLVSTSVVSAGVWTCLRLSVCLLIHLQRLLKLAVYRLSRCTPIQHTHTHTRRTSVTSSVDDGGEDGPRMRTPRLVLLFLLGFFGVLVC